MLLLLLTGMTVAKATVRTSTGPIGGTGSTSVASVGGAATRPTTIPTITGTAR